MLPSQKKLGNGFSLISGMTGLLVVLVLLATALANVDDDHEIGFIWEPPENADVAVYYYRVYLSVDGGPYREIDQTLDTYYIVEGDSGSTYRMCVAGVNTGGQQGPSSPESDEVLCLPQDPETMVFGFAAVEAQETPGQLKVIWETSGYLNPRDFQVRRREMATAQERILDVEVLSGASSSSGQFRYWCLDRNVTVGGSYRYTITAMDPTGNGALAISLYAEVRGPLEYRLFQNYPNPFNAETTISYQNPRAQRVVLTIYNTEGQKVCTLLDAVEAPGLHLVSWDGTDGIGIPVASGVYFCHMWCGDHVDVKKLSVIR